MRKINQTQDFYKLNASRERSKTPNNRGYPTGRKFISHNNDAPNNTEEWRGQWEEVSLC